MTVPKCRGARAISVNYKTGAVFVGPAPVLHIFKNMASSAACSVPQVDISPFWRPKEPLKMENDSFKGILFHFLHKSPPFHVDLIFITLKRLRS
jgi:hypothetical protein